MLRWHTLLVATLFLLLTALPAAAQTASPVADDSFEALFVQSAAATALTPTEGAEGDAIFTLVMQGSSAQTIYFADHPNRNVGVMPTVDAIADFTSDAGNPVNAALVAETADGSQEIIVFEIQSGSYDETADQLTYQVSILGSYAGLGEDFGSDLTTGIDNAREYVSSTLFIDSWTACIADVDGYPVLPYPC